MISQLLVIALYASGVTVLTGLFIYWFPGAETTLRVLAVIWLWMGIGFTGLSAFGILQKPNEEFGCTYLTISIIA